MARISFYLDKRYVQKNGKHALKLRISANKEKVYMPLGERFTFLPDEWDGDNQIVKRGVEGARQYNQQLALIIGEYEDKMNEEFPVGSNPRAQDVYDLLAGGKKKAREDCSIKADYLYHIERKADKPKSKESYEYSLRLLESYCDHINSQLDKMTFDDIDLSWLDKYKTWLLRFGNIRNKCGLSKNSVAIHMENLRAINNVAKKLKHTKNYAFEDFTINREEVDKFTMNFRDLRLMWNTEGDTADQAYYLDMFRIIFALCGINCVDLYNMRDENVKGDRLEFRRQKTGVFGSIKIEPETLSLIKKHRGKNGMLLNISERYSDVASFTKSLNKKLKLVGVWHMEGRNKVYDKVYWPRITTYTARYSWASAAGMEDVPLDTIDMGLTHKGHTMADRYVRRFFRKLDEANRLVLDIVTGKAEPTYEEALTVDLGL